MSEPERRNEQLVAERRRAERDALEGDVTVRFEDLEIVGPGRNISETGVYFVSEATARVRVEVDGVIRTAELIRVETLGNGRLGVAVRFVDDPPPG
jgi:hypothetical protein